jgi:hypothetical protein
MIALKNNRLPKIATMREQRSAWTHLLSRRNRARRVAVDEPLPPITSPLEIAGCVLWLDASFGTVRIWSDAPASGSGTPSYDGGGYVANGLNHALRVYPFRTVSGSRVYSSSYLELNTTDDGSTNGYAINWMWDAVAGAEGYRVLKSEPVGGFNFDYCADVFDTFFSDGGPGSFSAGSDVTPIDQGAATDTELVARWEDQSGANNHATQASATKQPVLLFGGLNGLPTLRFDAVDDGMTTPLVLNQPCTVFVVYCYGAADVEHRRAVQGSNNWLLGPYDAKHDFFYGDGFTDGPAVDAGTFVAQAALQNGSTSRNWINGAFVGTTQGAGNAPGTIYLGAAGTFAEPLGGDIAEVIAFDSALSDADMTRVWDYLRAKFALT